MIEQMTVPFVDLRAQYQTIKHEVLTAFAEVLEGMHLFLGENVKSFEQEFAAYCGTSRAIGVGSGTDALYLALRACDIGAGDEVITVANTFFATIEAIHLAGAKPVFVDVDPQTYTMAVDQIERLITPRTRAILPVHLYGQLADMTPIMWLAKRHGLRVIEDACQAHGARYEGKRAGAFGDAACFSFYFSKNLGGYGEGGAVVSNDEDLASRVAMLRDHGSEVRYHHDLLGVNSRLDELQAAVLRIKLRHLDAWNEQRRAHAQAYKRLLAGSSLGLPIERNDAEHVYHLFVVRSEQRDLLRSELEKAGVASGIHYPIPVHLQAASKDDGYGAGSLPITEAAAGEILSLPMFAELKPEQIEHVCESILRFEAEGKLQVRQGGIE